MDWSITLRLWHINRLISCVGLAAAREVPFFLVAPTYEESSPYYKAAVAESLLD